MKRLSLTTISIISLSILFGFCFTQDTSASRISSAWVEWNSGIDWDGGTTFGVGMEFGGCDGWCEQEGSFRCTYPGAPITTSLCDWSESYSWSDDYWDYYWVDLYPCYYEQTIGGYIKERRWGYLTAYAIDQDGNLLNGGNSIDSTWGYAGYETTVSRHGYNPAGYTPTNWWRWYDNENNWSEEDPFVSHTMNRSKTTYAYYEKNVVQGKSNAGDKSTGWQSSNSTADTYHINDCSPTSGCNVTFSHHLKRSSGSGSTSYKVTRTSNYWVSTKSLGVEPKTLANGTENFSSGGEIKEYEETIKLVPGQVVCESLNFGSQPGVDSASATTTACASAHGNAQPDNPSGADNDEASNSTPNAGNSAFLNIKVKNNTLGTKYKKTVYAKPNDSLTFRAVYNPILQYAYNLVPQSIKIKCGSTYGPFANSSSTMGTLFNNKKGDCSNVQNWNNAFNVYSTYFKESFSENNTYTNGDTSIKTKTNDHTVAFNNEVGYGIKETAETNRNDTVRTTPSQIEFRDSSGTNVGTVITNAISASATANIPYNFILQPKLSDSNDGKILYAGETASFTMDVTVNPKANSLTTKNSEKYATSVKGGKRRFKFCVGGHFSGRNCQGESYVSKGYSDSSYSAAINNTNEMSAGKTTTGHSSGTIYIPDRKAGTDFCVVSLVYPKNSGPDDNLKTNYYDESNEANWAVSAEKCFKIAKKPSLQVWGGNIFSSGTISTATSIKSLLAGHEDGSYIFGSWGELSIIASNTVRGMASGAGLGYTTNNNGTLSATPGGSTVTTFCDRSTLSFANQNCSGTNGTVGSISAAGISSSAASIINKDKDAIKNAFSFKGDPNVAKDANINLNDSNKINSGNIYYYYGQDNFTIKANTVNSNTLQVVESDKDITISGDITYENASYKFLKNEENKSGAFVPKLFIMAKNIKINCNVNRIDGILLAESTVTTCADSNDINAQKNSRQLRINGAIIASALIPNRTYGAGPGDNSIISAEIINYDPTLFLWTTTGPVEEPETPGDPSAPTGAGGDTSELNITYTKEVSPRL